MREIDEIRIEGEEDGFHLIIYTRRPNMERFRIGLPDQFKAEVDRTIGAWLAEGERARVSMPSGYSPSVSDLGVGREPDYDLARDIERGK